MQGSFTVRDDASASTRQDGVCAPPHPVARYLAFALPSTSARITRAHIEWSGTMLLERDGRPMRFQAHQHVTTLPPGFIWDATMRVLPGIHIKVRDTYEAGRGATRARLAGIVPIVNQPGTPETAESSLQRFLGEAIWFPTALLPGANLTWRQLSADRATATIIDLGNRASIDFCFGARGEIIGCSALRYRDVGGGHSILTPWRTRTWDYEPVDGIQVPRSGEAAWILPDGPLTYWRGTVDHLSYEF
jgi:hypothetical protein